MYAALNSLIWRSVGYKMLSIINRSELSGTKIPLSHRKISVGTLWINFALQSGKTEFSFLMSLQLCRISKCIHPQLVTDKA